MKHNKPKRKNQQGRKTKKYYKTGYQHEKQSHEYLMRLSIPNPYEGRLLSAYKKRSIKEKSILIPVLEERTFF